MAKRKDCLKIKELNGGKSKKTEKVEKTNQEVQEQQVKNELKKAQSQTAEDVNNFLLDGPSEEEDRKRLLELQKAIKELDEKEAEKANKANKADGAKTAAELEAEAQRWQKAMDDAEKKIAEQKKKAQAEIQRLQAEAKRVAIEEEKARQAALEAEKAEEARKAKEAKEAEEAARLEKEAREAVCTAGPKKIYQFRSPKTKEIHTTSDVWAAEQAAPGNWKAIWVWIGSNGKVHHVLTPEEIAEFIQ